MEREQGGDVDLEADVDAVIAEDVEVDVDADVDVDVNVHQRADGRRTLVLRKVLPKTCQPRHPGVTSTRSDHLFQ